MATAGLVASAPGAAVATTGSSELNLVGGDTLQANAFHCSVFVRSCSWSSSAKLLGTTPRNATWIQNNAEVRAHGPLAKISLGKSSNIEITFKSSSLIKTRWKNTTAYISDSSGIVSPSLTTLYVSTTSRAYAYHKKFGRPGPVKAYAGAI